MLRSLFSGISGLRAHQQMMDVTGNNISNINTAGFKSSQATFADTLSQMVRGAGAPQAGNGGTNPAQVGLGVRLAGIETNFAQGAAQVTGRSTDLMIQGDGFFVVRDGGEQLYTRAGSFSFDTDGRLVGSGGKVVQGWTAVDGDISTVAAPTDIRLPIGVLLPPTETTEVVVGGNLPGDTTSTTPFVKSITVYDALGNESTLSASFTKVTQSQWTATLTDGTTTSAPVTLTFDGSGNPTPTSMTLGNIEVDLAQVTNFAGSDTIAALSQNGGEMGSLQAFSIGPDGTLVGIFSNGLKSPLAQLALANFNNPPGLEKVGDSMYRTTVNSGAVQLGVAGAGNRGVVQGGALEMSNVDLAQEFTNLVIAQRGFQANSRMITASDELLQDLVNLKR
jgi:flagellar hook protein FlgE